MVGSFNKLKEKSSASNFDLKPYHLEENLEKIEEEEKKDISEETTMEICLSKITDNDNLL
jgi:SepF-like predicted cell division protein (DUF552 family)